MKTLAQIYGTTTYFKDRNPNFIGPNMRMDHIVKCPKCDQALAFTDILEVREVRKEYWPFEKKPVKDVHFHWGCPFCNHFIDHVKPLIKN